MRTRPTLNTSAHTPATDLGNRILKVNHAGEQGAIHIYAGQIAMARLTAPAMRAELEAFKSQDGHAAVRPSIRAELCAIRPHDPQEQADLDAALAWVDSGAELCRLAKPATPPKHLVSYFAVVDAGHILLVDHRNAQLWLPTGGHVEPGEHPRTTVLRELKEELGLDAAHPIAAPLMLSSSETVGLTAGHTDVSLWYVVHASRQQPLAFDAGEFHSVRWFAFDEVPFARSDPQMRRFVEKLRGLAHALP